MRKLIRPSIGVIAIVGALFCASLVPTAIGGPSVGKLSKQVKALKKQVAAIQLKPGPQGVAGAPATALFAGVDSDGTLSAQSGVVGTVSHVPASGSYTITFNRNVDPCVPVANLTNDDPGQILSSVLAGANNSVSVFTFDSAGTLADGAFSVAVFCA